MGSCQSRSTKPYCLSLFEELLGLKPIYGTGNGAELVFQGTEDAISRPLTEAVPDMAQLDQLLPLAKLGDVIALRAAIRKLSEEDADASHFLSTDLDPGGKIPDVGSGEDFGGGEGERRVRKELQELLEFRSCRIGGGLEA